MSNLNECDQESIQTIIVDSDDFTVDQYSIKKMYNVLKKDGSFFIIIENKYEDGVLKPISLEIAEMIKSCNFILRNSIVWFLPEDNLSYNNLFINRFKMIFHFTKNIDDYFFNKDPIREKHIWEKVEWGKRKKNYNPKGKDPGDFWLKTEDDGNAKIIKHIPLSQEDIIERLLLLSSKKNDNILMLLDDKKCKKICKKYERKLVI